jgi:hypothetical protein
MSSNSPSGGMKDMVRSLSNLPSFTHWWNWQSSSSTELFSSVPGGGLILPAPELRERRRQSVFRVSKAES